LQGGCQHFVVLDENLAGTELDEAFCLEAGEVAGDQFADSTELIGELLMAAGELDGNAEIGSLPLGLRQAHEEGNEALANGGEGELFDDANEAAQTGTDDGEHFEGDFWVFEAVIAKVALGDEGHFGVINRDD
jgi:hypothetical protein